MAVAGGGGIAEWESEVVVASSKGGVGSYGIVVNRGVSTCAKLAALRTYSGVISTDGSSAHRRLVEVRGGNCDTLTPRDHAFSPAVHC